VYKKEEILCGSMLPEAGCEKYGLQAPQDCTNKTIASKHESSPFII
jgi:hypothetical protein